MDLGGAVIVGFSVAAPVDQRGHSMFCVGSVGIQRGRSGHCFWSAWTLNVPCRQRGHSARKELTNRWSVCDCIRSESR